MTMDLPRTDPIGKPGTDLPPLRHRGEVAAELIGVYRSVRAGEINPRDGREMAFILRKLSKVLPRTLGDANALDETEAVSASLQKRR